MSNKLSARKPAHERMSHGTDAQSADPSARGSSPWTNRVKSKRDLRLVRHFREAGLVCKGFLRMDPPRNFNVFPTRIPLNLINEITERQWSFKAQFETPSSRNHVLQPASSTEYNHIGRYHISPQISHLQPVKRHCGWFLLMWGNPPGADLLSLAQSLRGQRTGHRYR